MQNDDYFESFGRKESVRQKDVRTEEPGKTGKPDQVGETARDLEFLHKEREKLKKRAKILSWIAFGIFLIILIGVLITSFIYAWGDSGGSFWFLIFLIWLAIIPTVIGTILAIIAAAKIHKCKKWGVEVNKSMEFCNAISVMQIPLFILILFLTVGIKDMSYDLRLNSELNTRYGRYKIIDKCRISGEDGTNNSYFAISLDDFEYPVVGHVGWDSGGVYRDNREEIMEAEKLDYQKQVKELFGANAIALMRIYTDETNTHFAFQQEPYDEVENDVYLNILLPASTMQNKDQLREDTLRLIDEYAYLYDNEDFMLQYYFVNKIEQSRMQDYYILLGGGSGNCIRTESKNLYKDKMSIEIDQNTENPAKEVERELNSL